MKVNDYYLDEQNHLYKILESKDNKVKAQCLANDIVYEFSATTGRHLGSPVCYLVEQITPILPILGQQYLLSNGKCIRITNRNGGGYLDSRYVVFDAAGYCRELSIYLVENISDECLN